MEVQYREGQAGDNDYFPPWNQAIIKRYNEHMLERLARVTPLLLEELEYAAAPLTSRKTACVLETDEGLYGGHVSEFMDGTIVPAITMALSRMDTSQQGVTGVWLTGSDIQKPKHVMPTLPEFDRIEPQLDDYAPIVVLAPDTQDSITIVSPKLYREAYGPKTPSIVTGDYHQVSNILERETALSYEDARFMHELRKAGIEQGIAYYLTGSAAGRGGASGIFTQNWSYGDLDIIAVTDIDKEVAEELFEEVAACHYGDLEKEAGDVQVWPSGEIRKGVRYTNTAPKDWSSIHLFIAPSLDAAVIRPEYFMKNFFHKVS